MRYLMSVAVVAALLLPRVSFAQQETATVIGTVLDQQGATLPGTTVTARNTDTGLTRHAVTATDGR